MKGLPPKLPFPCCCWPCCFWFLVDRPTNNDLEQNKPDEFSDSELSNVESTRGRSSRYSQRQQQPIQNQGLENEKFDAPTPSGLRSPVKSDAGSQAADAINTALRLPSPSRSIDDQRERGTRASMEILEDHQEAPPPSYEKAMNDKR